MEKIQQDHLDKFHEQLCKMTLESLGDIQADLKMPISYTSMNEFTILNQALLLNEIKQTVTKKNKQLFGQGEVEYLLKDCDQINQF